MKKTTVHEVLEQGLCTADCMVSSLPAGECSCVCGGNYHACVLGVIVKPKGERLSLHDYHITELDLPVRAFNCLKRDGIITVGALCEQTPDYLMSLVNFGFMSLQAVEGALDREFGARLKRWPDDEEANTVEDDECED